MPDDHEGPFLGIPPTGRRVHAMWVFFTRIRDGKVHEKWDHPPVPTFLQQIGAGTST